jgi:putative tryptophan/tyrosine transport system substrate-binding protein
VASLGGEPIRSVICAGGLIWFIAKWPPSPHRAAHQQRSRPKRQRQPSQSFWHRERPGEAWLVASLSRPGGNVTGMSFLTALLVAKQVELLHELIPSAEMIALLVNPKFPDTETMTRDARQAATARGKKLLVVTASTESDLNQASATLVREQVGALLVPVEPFFFSQRKRIVEMADRHAVPAIYSLCEFAVDGGLMSYGASLVETYRQVGVYVGRVLKGARPADLAVVQSTVFELIINLKAAKALGLQVPDNETVGFPSH